MSVCVTTAGAAELVVKGLAVATAGAAAVAPEIPSAHRTPLREPAVCDSLRSRARGFLQKRYPKRSAGMRVTHTIGKFGPHAFCEQSLPFSPFHVD